MPSLLTVGNPKTTKDEARGYLTAILHLAPANVAGLGTVCPKATPGCMATCLNTAGRGGIFPRGAATNAIQKARKRRTVLYKLDRAAFENALARDIARHVATAKRHGLTPCVRINGTSDLPGLALAMARRFPDVQFYDYTKLPRAWERAGRNYHVTFSRSESNAADVKAALAHGVNIAVVFSTRKGQALPATWNGRPVIDGDATDLRFLDPAGVVVGLRAKGAARRDASGFVVKV